MEETEEKGLIIKTKPEQAEEIAKYLKEKYPGRLVSKGGIKKIFNLPHVRAGEIFKMLEDYGIKQEKMKNVRVPTN